MIRRRGILAATCLLVALGGSPASAAAGAPPNGVTLRVASVSGTGCPDGTAAVAPSPDNTAFTVTYSAFTAQSGPGTSLLDRLRSCRITVLVGIPAGYTYAVAQVDQRGFASLAQGATATQTQTYFFTGLPTARVSHELKGPFEDNWSTTDKTPVTGLTYAPCGLQRLMTINTSLRVSPALLDIRNTNLINLDSTDGSVSTRYQLNWKSCRG